MSPSGDSFLSLVIPTCERAGTLRHSLKSALDQASDRYEILVSDNASADGTREVVREFSDPRLRYVNPGRRLSMCDHWEFALGHARGERVLFIGDDDAVLPGGIDRLERIVRDRPARAYMWRTSIYIWPIDGNPARLQYLSPVAPDGELDLAALAASALAHGGLGYQYMPGVYHGVVAREVLDAIRSETGRVFHSTQPDVFTAMAVPVFVPTAVQVGHPVTAHGLSSRANGGAWITKGGAAVQEEWLREFGEYALHPTLYPGNSKMANLIVDAILVAKDLFPRLYGSMAFDYDAMWAFMRKFHLADRWKVMPLGEVIRRRREIRRHHRLRLSRLVPRVAWQEAVDLARRCLRRKPRLGPFDREVPENVYDFVKALAAWEAQAPPRAETRR